MIDREYGLFSMADVLRHKCISIKERYEESIKYLYTHPFLRTKMCLL